MGSADPVLVPQCQAMSAEQMRLVAAAVRQVRAQAVVCHTQCADFPLEALVRMRWRQSPAFRAPGERHPHPASSHTLQARGDFARSQWKRLVTALGPVLIRLKKCISPWMGSPPNAKRPWRLPQ